MTLERQLLKQATTLTFASWKAQVKWVEEKVKEYPNDLDLIAHVVRRMSWPFKVDYIAERVAKGKAAAKKLKAIASTPMMTIAELKVRFPIKDYCEKHLGREFVGNKCKCPFHNGKGNTSFVVDPTTGNFTCFGGCQSADGKVLTGDVIDAHQLAFNLPTVSAAKQSLEQLAAGGGAGKLNPVPTPFLFAPLPKLKTSIVDEKLLAKVLEEDLGEPSGSANGATAADFAKLLLERILRPDDIPIVFFNKRELPRIIGRRARGVLERMPSQLQYFTSSVYIDEAGSNTNENIKQRIFLNVEFDELPLSDQLKVLWWLRQVKGWKLISITFSGSKSYHGLFLVRGQPKEQVEEMIQLAKRIGACSGSLRPHNPIRFPGGMRREPPPAPVRQEIIHLAKYGGNG